MIIVGTVILIAVIAILMLMLGFALAWLWCFYHYEDDEAIASVEGNNKDPKKVARNVSEYIADDFVDCVKFIFS